MSAECPKCGADLVYGEWPEMFCQPCTLRDRIVELTEELEGCRAEIREYVVWHSREKELRKALERIAGYHPDSKTGYSYSTAFKRVQAMARRALPKEEP